MIRNIEPNRYYKRKILTYLSYLPVASYNYVYIFIAHF